MSTNERNWTVLFIGGASGTGKSSIAYELARYFNVNIMEADDVCQAVEAMTTVETHPAVHYWSTGINWLDIGVGGNVNWLIDVSREMIPALKAIAENHIESSVPVIIEGDFIYPELTVSLDNPNVKAFFVKEEDKAQILQNYLAREGGELQHYRAEISIAYDKWLSDSCEKLGINVIEARPWDTAIERIIGSRL
jgi:2-phosphoglycerate kinase